MRYEDLPRHEESGTVLAERVEFPITYRLLTSLRIDGQEREEIEMREPTVLDLETAQREKGNLGITISLLSNLLKLTPEEVRRLGTRDFQRLSETVSVFL